MDGRRTAVALLAMAALAACTNREAAVNKNPHGGTGVATTVDGVQQVIIRTGVDLRFHPSTIVVHPGRVRIVLVNTAQPGAGPPHDLLASRVPDADVPLTSAGRTQSTTFTAPAPGTYSFVCSIHAAQGQTGKLIVK